MLEAELKRIVEIIKSRYHPEKIILFGSLASGEIHEWSDIDLAIVKRTRKRGITRFLEIADLCKNRVGAHFLVYTPKEFNRLVTDNSSFLAAEVVSRGKTVYP